MIGTIAKLLALAAALQGPAAAQPAPKAMTLGAAVDAALARSPAVEQARATQDEAKAGLAAARLSALPRLTAKTTVTRGDDPVYAFGSLLEQKRFTAQDFAIDALNNPGYRTNVKSSLELGVPVFTGFALRDQRELARIQVGAAGDAADLAAQGTRGRVIEAYLSALAARAVSAEAGERIQAASAEIDEARRLRARGLVLGSDFYAAQAVLAGLEAGKIQADNELAGAEAALGVLTRSGGAPVEPEGALDDASYSTAPLASVLETARRERRDLRQAAAGESAAAVLERRERESVLPTVDAFASLETDTSDFGSNPTNRLIGLRAALPFGDPTYFERGKRAAEARRAAKAGREALEQGVDLEVRQRYQEYEAATAMLPVLRDAVEKAQKSLELFRPLYREGRQSIFDVLRAEDALMKAKAGYYEALTRAHAGYARLEMAAGRLDASAVGELDRRLGGTR